MFFKSAVLVGLTATMASASAVSPARLFARQDVETIPCEESGQQTCGGGCIDLGWTCCPDLAGGCPPTAYCSLGDDGEYGCCPQGETCVGEGGANTRPGETFISTETVVDVIETSVTATTVSTVTAVETETIETEAPETETPEPETPETEAPVAPETSTTEVAPYPYPSDSAPVVPHPTAPGFESNATTTSPPPVFTGAAADSFHAAPIQALGVAVAALFML